MLNDFIKKVERQFKVVKMMKPKASRAKSSEMFILGMYIKQ